MSCQPQGTCHDEIVRQGEANIFVCFVWNSSIILDAINKSIAIDTAMGWGGVRPMIRLVISANKTIAIVVQLKAAENTSIFLPSTHSNQQLYSVQRVRSVH